MTNHRVLFEPDLVEKLLKKHAWECALAEVDLVRTIDLGMVSFFGPSLVFARGRDRIGVQTREGEEIFVVADGPATTSLLQGAVEGNE